MKEEIIIMDQFAAVGILTYSEINIKLPAIVIFNAGLVHRPGVNRAHVKLARKLCREGYNVFRFDYSGQGDSIAYPGILKNKNEVSYVTRVLDVLGKKLKSDEFILAGICSGAEDSYNIALIDNRIRGVMMVNGTGLSVHHYNQLYPEAKKKIQMRYYKKILADIDEQVPVKNGKKVVISVQEVHSPGRNFFNGEPEAAYINYPGRMPDPFEALKQKNIVFLLVLTEGSPAFDLINIIYKKNKSPDFEYVFIKEADHNITPVWAQYELHDKIIGWCNKWFKQNQDTWENSNAPV